MVLSRDEIDKRLQPALFTFALASLAGQEKDIAEAKSYLLDAVEELIRLARLEPAPHV